MKRKTNLFLAIIGFTLVGCSPKFYVPNTHNVPQISEKGEINLNLSGNGNQVEFQGAFGLTNHIAVQANGGLFIPRNLDNGNGGSGNFIELGGGYFKSLENNLVFDTYALFGIGSFENHLPSTLTDYPLTDGKISANIVRYGIQPSFGFKSNYFSAILSTRLVNLNYSKIDGDLIFENENQQQYLASNSSIFLAEPALTVRAGFEKIKFQVQYGYSFNLSNNSFRQDNSLFTIGLNFNFK